jgi:hypothetical protein
LIPQDDEQPQGVLDIVLQLRSEGNNLERINKCHLAYLPLHYVLLFLMVSLDGMCVYNILIIKATSHKGNNLHFGYFLGHQKSLLFFMVENFSNNSLLMRGLQHNKID